MSTSKKAIKITSRDQMVVSCSAKALNFDTTFNTSEKNHMILAQLVSSHVRPSKINHLSKGKKKNVSQSASFSELFIVDFYCTHR
jgi:hypothetical protein